MLLFVVFITWLNPLKWFNAKNEQEDFSENDAIGTTTAYGVKMQNNCFKQFDDFIKTYGADYSKCLADINFNKDYCGGFDPDTQGLSDVNIIVILDSSGSMAEKIDSEVKINIAKKDILDFLTKMPQGVKTGLVVYGHKGSNSITDKDLSCKGIEEVVKLGGNNNSNIIAAMDSFSPKGWTPIAGSIDFTKNIFNNSGKNNKNYLILLSDGAESCNGDPLVAVGDLKFEIPDIKLIVIAFATDGNTRDLLRKIAEQGGGSYLSANNSSEITKVFNNQLLAIKKDCLRMTILKALSINNANNSKNLNCWITAQKKEVNDFTINVSNKSVDAECNLETSEALQARYTEFWGKKQELEEKNNIIYKKIEEDLNNQLKDLEILKNQNY